MGSTLVKGFIGFKCLDFFDEVYHYLFIGGIFGKNG